jgi:hypothetical protein
VSADPVVDSGDEFSLDPHDPACALTVAAILERFPGAIVAMHYDGTDGAGPDGAGPDVTYLNPISDEVWVWRVRPARERMDVGASRDLLAAAAERLRGTDPRCAGRTIVPGPSLSPRNGINSRSPYEALSVRSEPTGDAERNGIEWYAVKDGDHLFSPGDPLYDVTYRALDIAAAAHHAAIGWAPAAE